MSIPTISTGEPSTLGTYKKIVDTQIFGQKAIDFINEKIESSEKGEDEVVIAHESQMMHLLMSMLAEDKRQL